MVQKQSGMVQKQEELGAEWSEFVKEDPLRALAMKLSTGGILSSDALKSCGEKQDEVLAVIAEKTLSRVAGRQGLNPSLLVHYLGHNTKITDVVGENNLRGIVKDSINEVVYAQNN